MARSREDSQARRAGRWSHVGPGLVASRRGSASRNAERCFGRAARCPAARCVRPRVTRRASRPFGTGLGWSGPRIVRATTNRPAHGRPGGGRRSRGVPELAGTPTLRRRCAGGQATGGFTAGPQVVQQHLGRDRLNGEVPAAQQPAAEGQQVIASGAPGPGRVSPVGQRAQVLVDQHEPPASAPARTVSSIPSA